jgi:NAD(P)H-nitrite reductase large subunit
MSQNHLVIIGNGITGVTVARNVRKQSDMRVTLISAETDFFFSRPALMYVFMGHMRWEDTKPYEDWFWKKNRIELISARVTAIDTDQKRLKLDNGDTVTYDTLVIATGSKTNKFGWPGQDLPGVQGLYSRRDVELLEENSRNASSAVIIGGGLIGIELAEMLHTRKIHVTFLVRENYYWDNILPMEDSRLVSRHILEHGFDLELGTELKEILAGADGRVRAVLTSKGKEIPCQIVGLTPGVSPLIDIVQETKIETGRGVLVNEYLETNIPGVYAAGDCAEIRSTQEGARNRLEQLWYTGKMQGEALAKTILGQRTRYDRGVWFNSAKFLDIEYQTYGFVSNVPRNGEDTFYWEHPSGKKSIRLVFSKADRLLLGVNVFGMRLRHRVFERWIKERQTVDRVVRNLRDAHFDPEFFSHHEEEILELFEAEYGADRVVA